MDVLELDPNFEAWGGGVSTYGGGNNRQEEGAGLEPSAMGDGRVAIKDGRWVT